MNDSVPSNSDDPRRHFPHVEWKPGKDRIYLDHEGWWHNDHPLEPSDNCCSEALAALFARFPVPPEAPPIPHRTYDIVGKHKPHDNWLRLNTVDEIKRGDLLRSARSKGGGEFVRVVDIEDGRIAVQRAVGATVATPLEDGDFLTYEGSSEPSES